MNGAIWQLLGCDRVTEAVALAERNRLQHGLAMRALLSVTWFRRVAAHALLI